MAIDEVFLMSCVTAEVASILGVILAYCQRQGQAGAPPRVLQTVVKVLHNNRFSCQKDPMGDDET